MTTTLTIRKKISFQHNRYREKMIVEQPAVLQVGRVPRVAKLLALAHRFDGLIRDGVVTDYADLARLGHVTRARVTQIMNLLSLAPDIQEEILLMSPIQSGKDEITERNLRAVSGLLDWQKQRRRWRNQKSV